MVLGEIRFCDFHLTFFVLGKWDYAQLSVLQFPLDNLGLAFIEGSIQCSLFLVSLSDDLFQHLETLLRELLSIWIDLLFSL